MKCKRCTSSAGAQNIAPYPAHNINDDKELPVFLCWLNNRLLYNIQPQPPMRFRAQTGVEMSLGSQMKERREELHVSRAELAAKIGVTPSAIANYENEISSPRPEYMYRLFNSLKCDVTYLLQDGWTRWITVLKDWNMGKWSILESTGFLISTARIWWIRC